MTVTPWLRPRNSQLCRVHPCVSSMSDKATSWRSSDEASHLLDRTVEDLVNAGVNATGTVRCSASAFVALEILEEAENCGASVIVMGCRGISDLTGLLVGSTAHKVLHLGRLPVLLIR